MAFCGTALTDEKKDVDCGDDHSLDNIVAFSTTKQQMCAPSKEGLIIKDKNDKLIDRRIKICYDDEKFLSTSYSVPCQITAILPNGDKGVGSALVCGFKGASFVASFVTCAHNLVGWSERRKCAVPYKKLRVYGRRYGEKKWFFSTDSIEKTIVHPKYNGKPECGYDLGIIVHGTKYPKLNECHFPKYMPPVDCEVHWMNPKDVTKGMTIELVGYPGEKKGYPYTHAGEILDITESDLGGWVLWYNADATTGNSGSAIWLTDEKYVQKHSKPGTSKFLIGVHTGHDKMEGCNFGTLLTKSLEIWLKKELEQ